jgi:hypothetical protein
MNSHTTEMTVSVIVILGALLAVGRWIATRESVAERVRKLEHWKHQVEQWRGEMGHCISCNPVEILRSVDVRFISKEMVEVKLKNIEDTMREIKDQNKILMDYLIKHQRRDLD